MKPPLTTACSHCAWMLKEGSDVTLTSASISSTEDLLISSVYNIFQHPVHVKLWVKILCNTITHEQQVRNHSIIVSEKNALFPILKKKTFLSASSTDGWRVVSEGAPPHKCRFPSPSQEFFGNYNFCCPFINIRNKVNENQHQPHRRLVPYYSNKSSLLACINKASL